MSLAALLLASSVNDRPASTVFSQLAPVDGIADNEDRSGPTLVDPDDGDALFRIDRFKGPLRARAELLEIIRRTHVFLSDCDGCGLNLVVERQASGDAFVIETIVKWRTVAAMEAAKSSVRTWQRAAGIDPQSVLARLKVDGDFGLWTELPMTWPEAAA
ncbi:hypothetical protein HDIA_3007 [Hartmannibacter diazotrophicus]|uniref:Antibiotic biosynthesis monooxygenase n=1 Tax=Hartmannibacter diazotrophicus TaxID=1482074 RepID=A0A2C9D8S4_9HYPH|nr:hypothetical protein [Hartmannibacter diazotrophicus]SON56548.1 hypothetical protein HDIA_3007 [Hartmannibacter diazotrophicus]